MKQGGLKESVPAQTRVEATGTWKPHTGLNSVATQDESTAPQDRFIVYVASVTVGAD